MVAPPERLAQSLSALKEIQNRRQTAIRSKELTRTHRERLLKNGFIQEVMKGWYIPSRPDAAPGESTAWYAAFWEFCAGYLNSRFNDKWCLSPEQSLHLHASNWTVPRQLLVRTPNGGNKPTSLLNNTSIFDIRLEIPNQDQIEILGGMRVMSLPAALLSCPPTFFTAQPIEMRTALAMIREPSKLLRIILAGGHSTVAGRLAGAFRNIGRDKIADTILDTMKSAGYTVSEVDPFEELSPIQLSGREISPYVYRLKMSWASFRQPIIDNFPKAPGRPKKVKAYLANIDDIYTSDAYHSLSIEGYRVSEELIEQVRAGNWNPDAIKQDSEQRDALAARGYWQAFQAVKNTIIDVLDGKDAGLAVGDDYATWYRELFGASVVLGIIEAAELAGFRNQPVYIRQSMHTPPSSDAVHDLIPAFFELLQGEESPEARVVLGHFIFVYIHPYIDGNGRMGRFLMNVMLSAGGYPWLIIPVERRPEYMQALEAASVGKNIVPFTQFLGQLLKESENKII